MKECPNCGGEMGRLRYRKGEEEIKVTILLKFRINNSVREENINGQAEACLECGYLNIYGDLGIMKYMQTGKREEQK